MKSIPDDIKKRIEKLIAEINEHNYRYYVLDAPVTLVVNGVEEADRLIRVRAAILFQSVIAGCSCTDDPTPMSELNEYCEVRLEIDRDTAVTEIRLAED